MFEGSAIDVSTLGRPPGSRPRGDSRSGPCSADDVMRAILKMPNYKGAPVLKITDSEDLDTMTRPHDGSVIELWKLLVSETAPVLHGAFQACWALRHSAQ
eukprot:1488013-Pyramimonas_sp.AAC.1